MKSKTITIPTTFTTRYIYQFCEMTNKLNDEIYLQKQNSDRRINAKSVLGVMSMCIMCGDVIMIFSESEDDLDCVLKWIEVK